MMKTNRSAQLAVFFGVLLCLSLGVNAAQSIRTEKMQLQLTMDRQRDLTDVARAMADIEVNLQKLLIASGAGQSAQLLGETALLAQHVESGISRLPMHMETAAQAMKFAGQMGDYAMTLAKQVSGGSMLTQTDETQIEGLLAACQGLNAHLAQMHETLYDESSSNLEAEVSAWPDGQNIDGSGMDYPSLIYDGPFSDGRIEGNAKGLTGERITREQARQAAARYAGVNVQQITDAADSGGVFEAFGFTAQTDAGKISVQVTGQGGHLLWMMPEAAQYETRIPASDCLNAAQRYLSEMGYGEMERCFVQEYDGMVVANFAAVQDGVLLYPDQVKLQISMETGAVVGAECSQYLMNHCIRENLTPVLDSDEAQLSISDRLLLLEKRLCVIPEDTGERLCWEFTGTFAGGTYYVYVDAKSGESVKILRLERTQEGDTVV